MATRILLLTGMSPDVRIFDGIIPRLPDAEVVPWLDPRPHESIPDYALRLADSIGVSGDVIVCGVSFGGIVARELAVHLRAKACVLVSSIRSVRQLPPWFRVFVPFARFRLEAMMDAIGTTASVWPQRIRTRSTARLTKLGGDAGSWHRWATASVLRWHASSDLDRVPLVQIHGDRDKTFPIRYVDPDISIPGGGHEMALTHASEISRILGGLTAGLQMTQTAGT